MTMTDSSATGLSQLARLLRGRLTGVVLLGMLLVLWELSARNKWIVSDNWPPVSAVVRATVAGILSGELGWPLFSTLYRAVVGFVIGSALGVFCGIILGRVKVLDWTLRPWIEVKRVLPITAIVPALILFFGVDDVLKIIVVTIATFSPVFVNTYNAVRGVDSTLLSTALTLGLSRGATLGKIVLPSVMPAVSAGMRISLSLALVMAVVGEMIAGGSGVGYYLFSMQYAMRAEEMYSAVLCLAISGYMFNRSFLFLERKWLHWHFMSVE